jgi:uncharacterized MnhB-related membrane protein
MATLLVTSALKLMNQRRFTYCVVLVCVLSLLLLTLLT